MLLWLFTRVFFFFSELHGDQNVHFCVRDNHAILININVQSVNLHMSHVQAYSDDQPSLSIVSNSIYDIGGFSVLGHFYEVVVERNN